MEDPEGRKTVVRPQSNACASIAACHGRFDTTEMHNVNLDKRVFSRCGEIIEYSKCGVS